jgi:hypothetical protein
MMNPFKINEGKAHYIMKLAAFRTCAAAGWQSTPNGLLREVQQAGFFDLLLKEAQA